jgi:hypothetical protein
MSLRISDDICLPREAATWVISYLAKRGAGKTYDAAVQAEEMLKAGIPIVVIDGMSTWWGLRVSSDGEHQGLPIVVFGGEHADLPLAPEKAAEMAKAIVESNISCVLDLGTFAKHTARKIVSSFLNELYRLNRVERHVFIEESDLWAPQKPLGPEEQLCLGAVDNFVRRGGNHNLGCTLITQRSAVLNKDILTQSDCLVVLRTLAPQDKKAIQAWVEEQTDENKEELKKWYDSLKELENGEAWVWHPEKPKIFAKVKFRRRETFHATREFIRSPKAAKILLMSVSEFVDRFKKVFESVSTAVPTTVHTSVNTEVMKEFEEYRSGRKLAESVQNRITLLEGMKKDLLEKLNDQGEELKLYDELKSVLRRMFPKGIPENPFLQQPGEKTVGLQAAITVVDLHHAEKFVTFNDENIRGKILAVAKKGKLDTWRQLGEIVKAIEDEHWNASPQEVNNALNDLAKEDLIAKKHTDRNYYCLAQSVKFKEPS